MTVVVLLADGARPDSLAAALDAGVAPALDRLRREGALTTVTSVFPSVTGPAYTPFLMGRFPGSVGLPGLRWYDRSRADTSFPDWSRSYVGWQVGTVDRDIAPDAPTIWELEPDSLGALNVISRGLPKSRQLTRLTAARMMRAASIHFRGDVRGWLGVDREVGAEVVRHVREQDPKFVFAAFTGIDKTSHAEGHESDAVTEAIAIVDDTAAKLRHDAEASGRWKDMHLWITSDHGHAPVHTHEDLAGIIVEMGHRVIAHPWVVGVAPDVAVMVSGNAMAHLYLEPERRTRPFWPSLTKRWQSFADALLARPSVDLMLVPRSAEECSVRSLRGLATVRVKGDRFSYEPLEGDPLGLGGAQRGLDAEAAHVACAASDYPDSIVQLARLGACSRSGDLVLSAAPGWDFRSKYEPIPHRSAHGALHRDHINVPLLTSRPPARAPRRTTDVFASAIAALGLAAPAILDGVSFL
ncbi:MAG: type phosphodiesterase/nucleotide pyrophosphatase [Gemmatimonadetes bacterium]|nr:type phosphodiesterase/nucleotide pyrophosphatase [Gemmatimonadota bacterium]